MGRKKITLDLAEVERLASLGLTEDQIGLSLGISQDTITRRKHDNADFADSIKRGKAKGIFHVTNKLRQQIDNNNVTSMLFFLKCKAGWSESAALEDRITSLERQVAEHGNQD